MSFAAARTERPYWTPVYAPRKWQAEALATWLATQRGIVEVVTGGGKTVFAFQAMAAVRKIREDVRFLILVPSLALADQWVLSLQEEFSVPEGTIGILGGGEKPKDDQAVVVAVLNSARTFSTGFASKFPTFLIVDECHRAGSPKNAAALGGSYVATLGLSATPEREYDAGFSDIIVPALGPIVFRYSYIDASREGVITSFDLSNIEVPMLAEEEDAYQSLSRRIAQLSRIAVSDPAADLKLKRLLLRRSAVVGTMKLRVPTAVRLIDMSRGERAIVFHERVADARLIYEMLAARKHNVTLYHAGIEPSVRREHLRRFRKGLIDVLVCCRALDEGTNVPETSIAVIASATASHRQRVQRLGRVLRPARGKKHATVYTLYGTKEERERLVAESEALSDITSVVWRRMKIRGDDGSLTSP